MRKIVIIGAGLTGLLAAIKLKKLGLDVVIADPRIGDYVRPGSLDGEVFKALSKAVGKDIEPSSSNHIKDAERALYDILKALDIEIKKPHLKNFMMVAYKLNLVMEKKKIYHVI